MASKTISFNLSILNSFGSQYLNEDTPFKLEGTPSCTFTIDPADILPAAVLSIILKMVDVPTRIVSIRAVSHKWRDALLQRSTWHDVDMDLSSITKPSPSSIFHSLFPPRPYDHESEAHIKQRRVCVPVFLNLLRKHPVVCAPASITINKLDEVWSNEASFAAALQAMSQVPKLVMPDVGRKYVDVLERELSQCVGLLDLTLGLPYRSVCALFR